MKIEEIDMKENNFVKNSLDSILVEWVNTGRLGDISSIISTSSAELRKVIADKCLVNINELKIWQDYYEINNPAIRKVLRGDLAELDEIKSSAKYKRIYNNGETEGISIDSIIEELTFYKEKLISMVSETNDYYIRFEKMRPVFDTPKNDSLFNNLSKVIDSYLEHLDSLGQVIDSVVESNDLNMVAILSDKFRTDLFYDLFVMNRYLNKVLTNIKQ